jgi:hypothetical protein
MVMSQPFGKRWDRRIGLGFQMSKRRKAKIIAREVFQWVKKYMGAGSSPRWMSQPIALGNGASCRIRSSLDPFRGRKYPISLSAQADSPNAPPPLVTLVS